MKGEIMMKCSFCNRESVKVDRLILATNPDTQQGFVQYDYISKPIYCCENHTVMNLNLSDATEKISVGVIEHEIILNKENKHG